MQVKSFEVMNLMYWESEEAGPSVWKRKKHCNFVVSYDRQTNSVHQKQKLPHYFEPSRNLLDRFNQKVAEMGFEEIPMDKYMDFFLLPLYQLRLDPLGKVLRQLDLELYHGI